MRHSVLRVTALTTIMLTVWVAAAPAHGTRHCHTKKCKQRVYKKFQKRVVAPYSAYFDRVNRCEATGRWFISTGNGYYGGLQFSLQSWRAVGGRGLPHLNSILEQKFRGVKLFKLQGPGAWPVCGR